MANNFTPINLQQFEKQPEAKKKFGINTVLLIIGALTAIVLIFMLFILVQKKMQVSQETQAEQTIVLPSRVPTPTSIPIPTIALDLSPTASVSASPTVTLPVSPTATPSGTLNNTVATPSATATP